jgi:LacI family transcriptional regulator
MVAPTTRQRVLEVIEETGFVRSKAAHQLRRGSSRTIGVVLLDIANPFFTEMVRGMEHALRDHGYVLILCSSDESHRRETSYLRVLEEHRVDGLLITPAARDLSGVANVASHGIPTVLLDRDGTEHGLCSVTVDDVRGGELAAGHLIERGHDHVVFVNGPTSIRQCADRRRGARRALKASRIAPVPLLTELTVPALTARHGEEIVPEILGLPTAPTAIMCANDLLALGVLRGVAAAGLAVPDQLSVIGYDDVTFASMLSPSLSSVRQPQYEMGAAAAELLLEEIGQARHEHRQVRFEPELVVRASTGRKAF